MSQVVDAHQHFWTYGTYQTSWMEVPPYAGDPTFQPLRRSFQLDDLIPELNAAGVHYRSDGHEGMRLGEAIAMSVLRDRVHTEFERFRGFSLRKFDGSTVVLG